MAFAGEPNEKRFGAELALPGCAGGPNNHCPDGRLTAGPPPKRLAPEVDAGVAVDAGRPNEEVFAEPAVIDALPDALPNILEPAAG